MKKVLLLVFAFSLSIFQLACGTKPGSSFYNLQNRQFEDHDGQGSSIAPDRGEGNSGSRSGGSSDKGKEKANEHGECHDDLLNGNTIWDELPAEFRKNVTAEDVEKLIQKKGKEAVESTSPEVLKRWLNGIMRETEIWDRLPEEVRELITPEEIAKILRAEGKESLKQALPGYFSNILNDSRTQGRRQAEAAYAAQRRELELLNNKDIQKMAEKRANIARAMRKAASWQDCLEEEGSKVVLNVASQVAANILISSINWSWAKAKHVAAYLPLVSQLVIDEQLIKNTQEIQHLSAETQNFNHDPHMQLLLTLAIKKLHDKRAGLILEKYNIDPKINEDELNTLRAMMDQYNESGQKDGEVASAA